MLIFTSTNKEKQMRFKVKNIVLTLAKFSILPLTLTFAFCLPQPLFDNPYSKVLVSREGKLLNAQIAVDGQWRFPMSRDIPERYARSIITFEDKGFYGHVGISMRGLLRATMQNIKSRKVVSGGSTLTMQTVRMARKRTGRSFKDKLIEMFVALRLELACSKHEILRLHSAHAPFGGNVVGLQAASWRYFGRDPEALSWAESTLLAVLPNAPGLMHLNKNREKLRQKRNRLLQQLHNEGSINQEQLQMSLDEPLPERPHKLPQLAMHLASKLPGGKQQTKLTYAYQRGLHNLLANEKNKLQSRGIQNAAILVYSVRDKDFVAYCGNLNVQETENGYVNVADKPRSSGSILKPFLYASAMEEGLITPKSLLPDYPLYVYGYQPKNYNLTYDGMVKADEALQRSLNIPSVHLLSKFGVSKFKHVLEGLGNTNLHRSAQEYGLSLILGGSECSLEDLCVMYSSFPSSLNAYENGEVSKHYTPGVSYATSEMLSNVERPGEEHFWKSFDQRSKIAWKTGTSFGARDAWAVGYNKEYIVAVWCGNASGEGVAGMTGSNTAGPLLFSVFQMLPKTSWFEVPKRDMRPGRLCRHSGEKAGPYCHVVHQLRVPKPFEKASYCTYHKPVWIDGLSETVTFKTSGNVHQGRDSVVFDIPVQARTYFALKHPDYIPNQRSNHKQEVLKLIYPSLGTTITLPEYLDGNKGEVVFSAAYTNADEKIMWFLDDKFVESTLEYHQIKLNLSPGKHHLFITDQHGQSVSRHFNVQ
jgi:penicillin-binding protein 1C